MRISSFVDSSIDTSSSIISASTMGGSGASNMFFRGGLDFLRSCLSSSLSIALSISESIMVSLLTVLELDPNC